MLCCALWTQNKQCCKHAFSWIMCHNKGCQMLHNLITLFRPGLTHFLMTRWIVGYWQSAETVSQPPTTRYPLWTFREQLRRACLWHCVVILFNTVQFRGPFCVCASCFVAKQRRGKKDIKIDWWEESVREWEKWGDIRKKRKTFASVDKYINNSYKRKRLSHASS